MIHFTLLHPRMTQAHLGLLPSFLSLSDPRPTREQIDTNYAHGGGWFPMRGFKYNPAKRTLKYPGDPILKPLAEAKLREEIILFYENAILPAVQPDGSFEVSRVD